MDRFISFTHVNYLPGQNGLAVERKQIVWARPEQIVAIDDDGTYRTVFLECGKGWNMVPDTVADIFKRIKELNNHG